VVAVENQQPTTLSPASQMANEAPPWRAAACLPSAPLGRRDRNGVRGHSIECSGMPDRPPTDKATCPLESHLAKSPPSEALLPVRLHRDRVGYQRHRYRQVVRDADVQS
jgi:hypothetical protein